MGTEMGISVDSPHGWSLVEDILALASAALWRASQSILRPPVSRLRLPPIGGLTSAEDDVRASVLTAVLVMADGTTTHRHLR